MTSGFSFFYLTRIKFITSTNTFTKSRKCHSAAHDGMAFFDAVWLASSSSSLEKVFACYQGLTVQPKHARRLLQSALSKGHQGNAFKRALRDAQRNIDKISTEGLKAAYNGIIDAISKGNEEMVDTAIDVATQESAILCGRNRPHWEGESLHGRGHVPICPWSRLCGFQVETFEPPSMWWHLWPVRLCRPLGDGRGQFPKWLLASCRESSRGFKEKGE